MQYIITGIRRLHTAHALEPFGCRVDCKICLCWCSARRSFRRCYHSLVGSLVGKSGTRCRSWFVGKCIIMMMKKKVGEIFHDSCLQGSSSLFTCLTCPRRWLNLNRILINSMLIPPMEFNGASTSLTAANTKGSIFISETWSFATKNHNVPLTESVINA